MNVPLIDMQKKTQTLVQTLGVEDSKKLFVISTGKDDNTHFVKAGAELVSKLAVDGIRENKLILRKYLVKK